MINNETSFNTYNKDTKKLTELQTVFKFLKEFTATASMISASTGIYQKNICRYKRKLEKAGLLWLTEKRFCYVTGHKAWYLTTDPEKTTKTDHQLKLFQL